MRFAAISTTEMPLSPIASEIAITSILLMWSVMSSVLKVEWEPESSVMKT